MSTRDEQLQWSLCVRIWHGPSFGHQILATTQSRGRDALLHDLGVWKGIGIPEGKLTEAASTLNSLFVEHIVTRYGVAGELPFKWTGEPDPF